MKKRACVIIFFLLASLVTPVYAEEKNQNRWYMGAKMGLSNVDSFQKSNFLEETINSPILGLFLGYEFNPYFSLEIANDTHGLFSYLISKQIQEHTVSNNIQIATKLSYPITDEFNIYTKLGAAMFSHDLISKNVLTNILTKYNSLSSNVSLGAEYIFHDSLITRFDYTWKNSFQNTMNFSIKPDAGDAVFSIGWKFGQSNSNDVFSSYDPDFLSTQYSVLNENVMFPFNSSELKPNAYDKLSKLSEDIKKMQLKNISIILLGHSDKIGNEQYNQKLSEDRAYSIKNYLTSKGFSRDMIIVRGVGALYSLTNQVCNGIKDKSLLVSCLAPDRRVEIEVLSDIQ